MDFTGKLNGVSVDFESGMMVATFLINEKQDFQNAYDSLKNAELLDIKCDKHKKKRSLNANAYFHVLVGKIAEKLTISKSKAKNVAICKYGQPVIMDDGSPMIYKTNAPEDFMWEQETIHAQPVKYDGNATFYKLYRETHTYNTDEMALLIDGVVADANELGIQTITPNELREMKERWGV